MVSGRCCAYSHLVTRGYMWTRCWSLCAHSVVLSRGHTRTQPPVSCYIATRAYTWMGHPVTVCIVSWSHVVTCERGTWSLCVQSRHMDTVPVSVCTGITWSHVVTPDAAPHSLHTQWSRGHGVWLPCARLSRGHAEMVPGPGCAQPSRGRTQRWCLVAGCTVIMVTSQGAFALWPGTCGDSWLLWSPAPWSS